MSSPGLSYSDDNDEDASSMLVPEMQAAYADLARRQRAATAALEKNYYAPQRAMWDKIAMDLEARRAGPSAAENLLALGAALSQPTKYRGFGGMIANVAPVVAEQQKAAREAQEAKRDLLLKYRMEPEKLKLEQRKAEIEGEAGLAQKRFDALKAMYAPRFVPGVGMYAPSLPSASAPRPANVPSDWIYGTDQGSGRRGWMSPDRKTFVPEGG